MGQVVNVAKYKIAQEVNDVAKHNLRCYIPKNVDPERQKDNIYFVGHQGQRGIHRLMAEKLEGVVHRKDANKVVNLVFGASNEEFEKMGPDKANKWAKEINDYCIKKFGKENVLYSVLHNDETTRHLHFSFVPLREGKLQSNYWFDGPAKVSQFRKEIYKINKKYGIAKDVPTPSTDEKKATRQEIDDFYKKVKKSERLDDAIDAEIEKVKDLSSFTLNPGAKITKLTPTIQNISDYANTASVRIKALKSKNTKVNEENKKLKEELNTKKDELNRFAEVDILKKLSYAELNELNSYAENKYQDAIEQREAKAKNPTPTPKKVVSQEALPVDRKIKIR